MRTSRRTVLVLVTALVVALGVVAPSATSAQPVPLAGGNPCC